MARQPSVRAERVDQAVEVDDHVLVARVRAGDERAFNAIFRQYYRPLCGFALGYVGSLAYAEELVQDVFARLWTRRGGWEVRQSLRSYLYALVRNHTLNALRHRRIEARWEESAVREAEQGSCDTEEQVDAGELRGAIDRAIAGLPARCREVVVLRRDHHLTVAETAAALGVSAKRIEALLTQAYAALRTALAPYR